MSSLTRSQVAGTAARKGNPVMKTADHEWLQALIGTWEFETSWPTTPGQPDGHARGREVVRAVGDLWVVGEASTQMPGDAVEQTMITLGYDPKRNHFVGTFIGSMMTHLWVYEGTLDDSRRVLTLRTTGPDMSGKGDAAYRDIIEVVSADERIMTGNAQQPDGSWQQIMEMRYRRVSSS